MRTLLLVFLIASTGPLVVRAQELERVRLEPPGIARATLEGQVVDLAGQAWAGTDVTLVSYLIPALPHVGEPDVVSARSDTKGQFTADLLPCRTYLAWAAGEELANGYRVTDQVEGAMAGVPLTLRERAERQLPAKIRFLNLEAWKHLAPFSVRTTRLVLPLDEEGRVTLPPAPAELTSVVLVDRDSRYILSEMVPISQRARQDFHQWDNYDREQLKDPLPARDPAAATYDVRVPPPATVVLRLQSRAGRPIAGAQIFAQVAIDPFLSDFKEIGRSDAQGIARLETAWAHRKDGRPFSRTQLLIRAEGFADGLIPDDDFEVARRADGSETWEASLTLADGVTVKGRLMLDRDQSLANAPLVLYSSLETDKGTTFGIRSFTFTTDAAGRFACAGRSSSLPFRLCALLTPDLLVANPDLAEMGVWPEVLLRSVTTLPSGDLDLGTLRIDELPVLEVEVRRANESPAGHANLVLGEVVARSEPTDAGGMDDSVFLDVPPEEIKLSTDAQGRTRLLIAPGSELGIVAISESGCGFERVTIPARSGRSRLVLALQEHLTISGRVIDSEGRPVPGASVSADLNELLPAWVEKESGMEKQARPAPAFLMRGLSYDGPLFRATSDSQGSFQLFVPNPEAVYHLRAGLSRDGTYYYSQEVKQVTVHDEPLLGVEIVVRSEEELERKSEEIRAAPAKPQATLHITVISKETRTPLKGVGVSASGSGSDDTDENGVVEIAVPADQVIDLYFNPDGEIGSWIQQTVGTLSPGERRVLEIELATALDDRPFCGRVVADETALPVQGAKVSLFTSYETGEYVHKEIVFTTSLTDADGRFECKTPSWKQLSARIEAEGFTQALASVSESHGTPEAAVEIRLHRPASLQVTVLDGGAQPLPDMTVRLSGDASELTQPEAEYADGGDLVWSAKTGADGRCSFVGLAAKASLTVELFKGSKRERKEPSPLTLSPGEARSIELRVGAGASVRGLMLDQDGVPVQGQAVWLKTAEEEAPCYFSAYEEDDLIGATRTDAEGRFAFEDVTPGRYWVGSAGVRNDWDEPDPRLLAPVGQSIEVGPDGANITLEVYRGLYIQGRVLDPEGQPAEDVFIMARSQELSSVYARSRDDGSFAVGPLPPGEYYLETDTFGSVTHGDSEAAVARAGDRDVVLQLRIGGGIQGKVIDKDGRPCDAMVVALTTDHTGDWPEGSGMGSSGGDFTIGGLRSGRYLLFVWTDDGLAAILRDVTVTAGSTTKDILVTLAKGGKLHLRSEHPEQGAFVIRAGGSVINSVAAAPSTTEVVVVPPGELTVELWIIEGMEPKKAESRTLTVNAGEEKEAVFGEGG
ncbi:MAG: carboxypeptidase regulatory-like domain-containing protein [Planctomycetota bacterium]